MKTLCITLPETLTRVLRARQHFDAIGLEFEFLTGIHAETFGLLTHHPYDYDHPGTGYRIPAKHVGLCLSHYLAWSVCDHLPDEHFLILEDDALFCDGWQTRLADAMANVPADFDMLFIGSCNCSDKPKRLMGGDIWRVEYPSCTHAYVVAKKALPKLLATQRKIFAPIDLALQFNSFPTMNVYTVLPRIVGQYGQVIGE